MIAFSRYYNFSAEDVEYIEANDSSGNNDYPYQLTVHTKSGQTFSVSYKDSKSRNAAKNEMVQQVERQKRQESEQLLIALSNIRHTVERVEKRQLRIWRQLRDLLGIRVEED